MDLNAKNYTDELAEELDAEASLTKQWRNFEAILFAGGTIIFTVGSIGG